MTDFPYSPVAPKAPKLKEFPPELARAMQKSLERADAENIDINAPIEGYVGL